MLKRNKKCRKLQKKLKPHYLKEEVKAPDRKKEKFRKIKFIVYDIFQK